jgi:hypothetical protein
MLAQAWRHRLPSQWIASKWAIIMIELELELELDKFKLCSSHGQNFLSGRLDETRYLHGAPAAGGHRAGPAVEAGHRDLDRDRAVTMPVTNVQTVFNIRIRTTTTPPT